MELMTLKQLGQKGITQVRKSYWRKGLFMEFIAIPLGNDNTGIPPYGYVHGEQNPKTLVEKWAEETPVGKSLKLCEDGKTIQALILGDESIDWVEYKEPA